MSGCDDLAIGGQATEQALVGEDNAWVAGVNDRLKVSRQPAIPEHLGKPLAADEGEQCGQWLHGHQITKAQLGHVGGDDRACVANLGLRQERTDAVGESEYHAGCERNRQQIGVRLGVWHAAAIEEIA
jgi:hypothetical protein